MLDYQQARFLSLQGNPDEAIRVLRRVIAGGWRFWYLDGDPALKSLLVFPWRVLGALLETMAPLLDVVGQLEPVAVATISLGLVSMMLTIAWVVGNDLRRPLPIVWRKEE